MNIVMKNLYSLSFRNTNVKRSFFSFFNQCSSYISNNSSYNNYKSLTENDYYKLSSMEIHNFIFIWQLAFEMCLKKSIRVVVCFATINNEFKIKRSKLFIFIILKLLVLLSFSFDIQRLNLL